MASAVAPVWQDPYVEVIKFGMTHRNVGWHVQGEVEQTQDQQIHKHIFRIRGAIAATNYLRVPRDATKGTHGLGLTGRYAYIQVRRIRDLPMTIHLDFVTNKKTALRFTLSSIYQTFRSTGTALRVPLTLDDRWTVVVVDMVRLLEFHSFNQYARDSYRHLKTITLCASMNVRNLFISPTLYTPTTLPTNLRFPGDFGDQYCWLVVPSEVSPSLDHPRRDPLKQENLRIAATPTPATRVRRNSVEFTQNINPNIHEIDEAAQTREIQVVMKDSPKTRDTNLRRDRNDILSKADRILRDAGIFDTANSQESMDTAYQSPLDSSSMRFAALTKRGLRSRIVSSSTKEEWPDPILELDRVIGFSNSFPRMLLWLPDGSACIYTSASTIIVREFCGENTAPSRSKNPQRVPERVVETNDSTEAVKGSLESSGSGIATRENFLYGHLAPICALAVTYDGGLLASAELPTESTLTNGVRLWNLASRECITVVKAQAKGVHILCFSTSSKRRLLLCVVGRDECFRTQIFIWDCSGLRYGKENSRSASADAAVSLMARQTSDFGIERIAFSPYEAHDNYHLVSCGRENVRYWRVNPNTGHLTGCPVILNEYSRGTIFTDIGFDTVMETHPSDIRRVRPLYVASSLGTLLVIDYDLKQVLCVYQLHDASINCLSINEGFCVTGSDDCFLRVWPLDFTDFFLEAHHEAGVSSLDVSADGMKVLVGSRNNAIGVLDIADQHYTTLLRSHTKEITAMTPAPWRSPLASLLLDDVRPGSNRTAHSELITASTDGTFRVWDTSSGHQLYEFDMQQEQVTCLAASPVNNGIVAVGFASGSTRIFNVYRTSAAVNKDNKDDEVSSMLHELQQHESSIRHIEFNADSQHLYTSGAGKQLCLYDARQQDYLPLKMLLVDLDPDDGRFELSHDKKWLAVVSSDRQSIIVIDPCSLRVVSMVQPPKLSSISSSGHDETLKLVRFSNHSTELLVLSASDRLHIFSLPAREYVQSMPLLGQDGISALVMSANAKYMATGGADGSLRVWNWDDKGRIARMHQSFIGHAGKVNELAFTKDGKKIIATGESSALCIWQFHGDSSPLSPRAKSGIMQYARNDNADDINFDRDGRNNNDNACVSETTSKPNFRLSLEDDALMLSSCSDTGQYGRVDSVLSTKTDLQEVEVPALALSWSSDISGDLVLSNAVGGFDPSNFVWSYSTGKLLYTRNAVVVVEDIASGQQEFCGDLNRYDQDRAMDNVGAQSSPLEIVLMLLSPSGKYVAAISSKYDVVLVRSLARSEDKSSTDKNFTWTHDRVSILIDLPSATHAASALAFAQQSHHNSAEKFLCMACQVGKLPHHQQDAVIVASVAHRSIIWSSVNSSGLELPMTRQIVATSDSEFLLFSSENRSVSTLTVYQDEVVEDAVDFSSSAKADLQPLVGVFPTQVRLISLYNQEGNVDRLRYLAGVDNDRYCYFYDIKCSAFIATTQLLLPSKMKNGSIQASSKLKNSASRKIVEFMEWVTTAGKSLIITGSRNENVLYVHELPMLSTKHSSRVQVDWERVARAGVLLLCKIPLSGGLLRSLSVDPARDIGIATTNASTVSLVHFDALPSAKVLRETPASSNSNVPFASYASWGLDGAVLLSNTHNDNMIRVWMPELSREVASYQVDSGICTCFAVNPFSMGPEGVPQSMVMAAYSDGSLRVFDLCEMRLLSRFELTPSSAKPTQYERAAVDRVVFVGEFTALIAAKDHSVFLVDISNALKLTEEAPSERGRTPPRPKARLTKKTPSEKTTCRMKTKPRATDSRQEVVYRELNLLPSSYTRRKRLPTLAKSEQIHAEVGAIDVKMGGSDANIHPFLVVVKYSGPARYKEGRSMVKVFAEPAMSVSTGENILPTDEWRLNNAPGLKSTVVFIAASSPEIVRVLYSHKQKYCDHDCACKHKSGQQASELYSWGLAIRDCTQQCVIQNLTFTSPQLANPVLLRCIHVSLRPESPQLEEAVLLMDSQGRMAVLDLTCHQLIPINSHTVRTLQLKACPSPSLRNSLLLLSTEPSSIAVASLSFQTLTPN